jgi:hypothetical protein
MATDARFRDTLKSLLAALGSPHPARRQKARQTIRDTLAVNQKSWNDLLATLRFRGRHSDRLKKLFAMLGQDNDGEFDNARQKISNLLATERRSWKAFVESLFSTLAEDLDRRGFRSKSRQLATGRIIGGGRFGVGALAHLLKNRFYIGAVVYRGEVYRGDHPPILDSALFAAVQEKLAAQAVERRCRLRGASALLAGRLYDECSNRMSPSHTNKGGARDRY